MWKGRTKTAPVILGAQGTIAKVLDKKLQLLPDHTSAMKEQNITLISTAYSIREVLG
jgi:hypothetical protein